MSEVAPSVRADLSASRALRHADAGTAGEDGEVTRWETRVGDPGIAAGDNDRIPRIFLGTADLVVLGLALLAADRFAPAVQQLLLSSGLLDRLLPAMFRLPAMPRPELFPVLSEVIWLLATAAPATLVAIEILGGYGRLVRQSAVRVIATAIASQIVAVSFSALIVFALKLSSSSRVVIFTYALFSALGLLVYRGTIWGYQRRRLARGVYAKNILLVGQPRAVEWMVEHFRADVPESEFRLTGWLRVPAARDHLPERRRDDSLREITLEQLGDVHDLGDLLVHHPVHEVIAVQSSVDREWLRPVIDYCEYFRVRLRIVPEALILRNLRDLQLAFRGDPLRLPEVVLAPPHLDADVLFVKRLIDIVVSAVLLVLLAPLLLLIAIAIKLTTSRLPVFYPWRVVGLNGRPFTGYKFTTMVADADEQKQHLLARNEMQGPVFKLKDDPRVTPLGRFLRKFSLNELPQLWSVLKGDMSLVGPRPAFRHELDRYELWHKRKLCIKPGLTCLWQVSGRNRITDFNEWVRLDLEYIDRWSLWLDMRILARTAWAVVSGSGS
jgi:exopolysaccharide biosynthesis polyprenyl glycosylphosphotransferase